MAQGNNTQSAPPSVKSLGSFVKYSENVLLSGRCIGLCNCPQILLPPDNYYPMYGFANCK